MKRLMYLSVSILCLSLSLLIGFHLGVRNAEADWTNTGTVIGQLHGFLLTKDGLAWNIEGTSFVREATRDIPTELLPQIKSWSASYFVTNSDEVYALISGLGWVSLGTPGVPSSTEPTTWGKLKSQYQNK